MLLPQQMAAKLIVLFTAEVWEIKQQTLKDISFLKSSLPRFFKKMENWEKGAILLNTVIANLKSFTSLLDSLQSSQLD